MKKKDRNIIIGAASLLVILVATVAVTTFLVPCPTSASGFAMVVCEAPSDGNGEMSFEETLARCLTNKGVKMYGAYWCGHCKSQKESFGDAFQYVDYVECTETPSICESAGVSGYPTWVGPDLAKYPGNRELSDLADLFGC
ncbi:MAG: hypothetical protein KKB03_04390 [Nanoarchaeota archaeon]|nr:hypothetical protein [Nanoarchaeota archaeon]MBU1135413.1 hypothetical protein [Nanoarchaeota archaeon]MBU2520452.1 hypothetical protein [Nanoarchaeota archaeon]